MTNEEEKANSPGGEHYRANGDIQPIDLIDSQQLGFYEANIIKYVCRWRNHPKGLLNLEEAKWYLNRLIRIGQNR